LREGFFTGDPGRYVKEASEIGVCFCWGPNFGERGGASSLEPSYLEKFLMRFSRDMQMPCEQLSLSIGALIGNLEGVRLPGFLRERKSISGSFLGPRGH